MCFVLMSPPDLYFYQNKIGEWKLSKPCQVIVTIEIKDKDSATLPGDHPNKVRSLQSIASCPMFDVIAKPVFLHSTFDQVYVYTLLHELHSPRHIVMMP